ASLSACRRLSRVLMYESPTSQDFAPDLYVDAADVVEAKADLVRAHVSQVLKNGLVDIEALEALARYRGFQARIRHAEAFESDGTETLSLHMSIPRGIGESHVCLAAAPFTTRVSPGSCPYGQGGGGTTADYQIPLGTTYAGRTLYVQAHAVTLGDTAYAGWQS